MRIFIFLFFLCVFYSSSLLSLENQVKKFPIEEKDIIEKCHLGYIYVDGNEQQSGGGHTGILVYDQVYHFQRNFDTFFTLDRTPLSTFLFSYSRIMNRNIYITCILPEFLNQEEVFNDLKDHLEEEHIKGNYVKNEYIYYDSLIKLYKEKKFRIPAIDYFDFPKEIQIKYEECNHECLINNYDSNVIFWILEKFYDFYKKNDICLNASSFIFLKTENLKKTKDFFNNHNNQKKIEKIIKDWEDSIKDLETSFRKDKFLAIFESLVYLQTLKFFQNNKNLIIPLQIVQFDKEFKPYDVQNLNINSEDFFAQKESQSFLNDYYRFLELLKKEDLHLIQQYLQKLSFHLNHLILFISTQEEYLNFSLLIYRTPQILSNQIQYLNINKEEIRSLIHYLEIKKANIAKKYRDIFEYQLIFKNCVTELFKIVNIRDENLKAIFKELEEDSPKIYNGVFIPWVSEIRIQNLLKKYNIPYKVYYFPSFRNELLAYLKNHNPKEYQKEFSTITSSYYQFHSHDSFFLFFTEKEYYTMPILGIFNFLSSTVYTLYDILQAPFTQKIDITRDLRGVFYSFTEILFVSIRKGTYYPRNWDEPIKNIYFSLPHKIIYKNH